MVTKAKAQTKQSDAPAVEVAVPEGYALTAVPTVTRITEANPHLGAVKALADTMGDSGKSASAVQVTLPAFDKDEDRNKNRAKLARQLADAGKEHGITVRKIVEEQENGTAVVTFWTVGRITRPRKNKDNAAAESAK